MKTRSFYPLLLALFAIESVLCQNAEELPIAVETDNQFPPEYSESDGHSEDSVSTAAEPTQPTPGSTTTDVPASTLVKEDEQVTDEGSEITAAEPTETTLEPTITDAAAESSDTTPETTIADVPTPTTSNGDEQDTKIEDNETTVTESTQTTSESTVVEVAVPALASDNGQVNKNEDDETTTAESTKITSGSIIADTGAPNLTIKDAQDTTYEDSETTAVQPTELTSEPSSADVGTLVLANDDEHVTNTEGSETTLAEPTHTTSGSTTSDVVAPTLTSRIDQVTSNEGSETKVVEPTESTPESPNIAVDTSKLPESESPCPEPCICITEGDSSDYIVDCSGHGLTDLPAPIDPKTTTLKLQNNQLTVIPKGISELKHLKNLNVNDNLISELESGSVSELPELVSLKLANNRFQEYPKDLENALNLYTLEELDLAGNELKTTPDIFLNLKALRTVTLPEISSELVSQICSSKETLVTICTESCSEHSFECKDVSLHSKDTSLDATLPGMIPFFSEIVKEDTKNTDNILANSEKEISDTPQDLSASEISSNSRRTEPSEISPKAPEMPFESKDNLPVSDFSLRTAVNNAPQEKVALQSIVIDNSIESPNNETDVKVGAKTTETKSSGVDKSVIAVIVAGMVIIVAVIAIKKNWGAIRKRFSSTPRANDRSDRNANGTTVPPEEVPLQDKSPV